MKKELFFIKFILIVLLAGCRGTPQEAHLQWTVSPPAENRQLYFITDYKNKDLEEDIPAWVTRYDNGGIQIVEYLQEYQNKYIFISKNTGTNFNALQQWVSGFRLSHDFARLVSARIQTRLTNTAVSYPDQDYGAFFEVVVKASSDAVYSGAVKEDDFWTKKQYFQEDGVTVDREVYDFLILVSIERTILKPQIDAILNGTRVGIPPTRDQIAAINQIKGIFYEGF